MMVCKRRLILIVIALAATAASSAFARSVAAARQCPTVTLSRVNLKFALQIKVRGVSCAGARRVERADYRAVAVSTQAFFKYRDGAWRCVNRAVNPMEGVPYVNVVCKASRRRSISFAIGGT